MKTACLALLALLPAAGPAAVHYLNRGTKYHVGDAYFAKTVDFDALEAYPVVGQGLVLPFKVSHDDEVSVTLEKVWGINPNRISGCRVIINGEELGVLDVKANGGPWTSPGTLKLAAGRAHQLRIVSLNPIDTDNFMVEGVVVATAKGAEVIPLGPPKIVRFPRDDYFESDYDQLAGRRQAGPCDNLRELQTSAVLSPQRPLVVLADSGAFAASPELAGLGPGQRLEFRFKAVSVGRGDAVRQPLEVLLGRGEAPSGWVLSFEPGRDRPLHGNLLLSGRYTSRVFSTASYLPGQWNRLSLGYCADGTISARLNGTELTPKLAGKSGLQPVRLRAMGLELGILP